MNSGVAGARLDGLATAPATPLFTYTYEQTPGSVADIAGEASSMRNQVLLAKVWVPSGLAATAVLSLVVGAAVYWHRRPRRLDGALSTGPVPEAPPTNETLEPVTMEGKPT